MTTLSSLMREKDEIIERLQLVNRPVADLSLESLKSIIAMKERLNVVNNEIDKSGLLGRINIIEKLTGDLKQSVENKLRVFRNQLGKGQSDNRYTDIIFEWSSGMEEKLKEVIEFAASCTEAVKKSDSNKGEEEENGNQKVVEPGQLLLVETVGEQSSSYHYSDLGILENRSSKESNKPEPEFENPSETDTTCCENTAKPGSPNPENEEHKKINECIQNSINGKMGIEKTITGMLHTDTCLPYNNEMVKKLQDFIDQNNKLQQTPLINPVINEKHKKKHPGKYKKHGKKDSIKDRAVEEQFCQGAKKDREQVAKESNLFETVNKNIGAKDFNT